MKILMIVLLSVIFPISITAQSKSKWDQNQILFTQQMLNKKLLKAQDRKVQGTLLAIVGSTVIMVGQIKYFREGRNAGSHDWPQDNMKRDLYISLAGINITAIGIIIRSLGKQNESHIKAELLMIKGNASVNGIGLRVRF